MDDMMLSFLMVLGELHRKFLIEEMDGWANGFILKTHQFEAANYLKCIALDK